MVETMGETTPKNSPSNIPDPLIVFHHAELTKIEADEEEAKSALKKVRDRKKKYRKTVQADGLTLKNFDQAREILLEDEEVVRANMDEIGRLLRAFKSPLQYRFDLFEQKDKTELLERMKFEGFRAGSNGVGADQNPHRRGDQGFEMWEQGWLDAQKTIAAGMELSQSTNDEEPEPEEAKPEVTDEPDDLGNIEEAAADDDDSLAGDDDWREERDAEDPPEDEDSALHGVEA